MKEKNEAISTFPHKAQSLTIILLMTQEVLLLSVEYYFSIKHVTWKQC